jgi:nucleoside-diphosphate-sugar epimerase
MNVVVTGGSGRIGRYVVRDLVAAGHQVTSIDVVPGDVPGARSLRADLTDAGEIYQVLASAQAEGVVHMGAWAGPGYVPDTRTYGDNVRGTFNLLQACADLAVRRVVSASSNHVYGIAGAPPLYVPVDEAHPLRPVSAYGLSKAAGEQAAAYFAQRGLKVYSFRLLGVRLPARLDVEIDDLVRHPERQRHLLWTRCDVRDAALACRLALEAVDADPGPYNISGPRVILEEESAGLVARYYPETEIREGLNGPDSPFSCARAEAVLGYRPRYAWSVDQRYLAS